MQTKHEIERILASAGTTPNKRLGQNFLIDLNLMRKLIAAADVQSNDVVLEVCCGTGSFTEGLSEAAGFLVGVEYDHILGPIVQRNFKDVENVKIINSDILENKNTLCTEAVESVKTAQAKLGGRILLVANLPYNVAASIMANLITGDQLTADVMYVTVQKEVAERMAAAAGDKRYGILSILMAATGNTEIIKILPASVFWPRPKVESAMVKFQRNPNKAARIKDMHTFTETVNLFMAHRRKMLKATTKLAEGKLAKINNWPEIFNKCKINPKARPEKLTPDDYITLANTCCE